MRWLKRLWGVIRRRGKRPLPLSASTVSELPETLDGETIYLVGEGSHTWSAAMLCPCSCGEVVHLNLLPGARPRWRLTEQKDGTLSLYPSVWRLYGCRSHFVIRRSRIEWITATKGLGARATALVATKRARTGVQSRSARRTQELVKQ